MAELHRSKAQELADIRKAMRGCARKTGVFSAKKLIRLALERHGDKLTVSWSGGRCSTALLRMVLDIKSDITAIYENTGVDYPEMVNFVSTIAKEWGINLIVAKPELGVTFWEVIKKYGFPEFRIGKGEPACCRYLKIYPFRKVIRELGIDASLTGMRASESRNRMYWTEQAGQFYFIKKHGQNIWKYNPIIFWSHSELARFEVANNIPICPIYQKYGLVRSGCWPCTGYKDWERVMARTHPKVLLKMKELMEQRVLDHYYHTQVDPPCKTERGSL